MNPDRPAPPTNYRTPLLLVLVFFGPLVAATLMYYLGGPAFRPTGSVAHGELLSPPPVLPDADYSDAAGQAFRFRRTWSLIDVAPGDCDPACLEALYRTRQVRRALGKEMGRVQRVLLATGTPPAADLLAREHPGLLVVTPASPAGLALDQALGPAGAGAVFIADPLGNLVMRFPAGTAMKDLHKDLVLLLKASRIG